MKVDKKDKKACLLCLQEKANKIGFYTKRGLQLHVFEILIKHFPWLKDEAEKSTKQRVCLVCWRIVREFHEFYQSVAKAYKREETYDSNVKLLDKCPASTAAEDEALDDPLPAPAKSEEPKSDQCEALFEVDFLDDSSLQTPVKIEESTNDGCLSPAVKIEANALEMDFFEELEAPVDIQIVKEQEKLSSETGTLHTEIVSIVKPPRIRRSLRATRQSQCKEKETTKKEFSKIENFQDDDSETELPLSMLLPTTLKSSKSKKRGRPVKSKVKIVQIEAKEPQIKAKTEDNSNNGLKISDDECHFEDNATFFNKNEFNDSDSLSDIDEPERRADIVAPPALEKPRRKRVRLRPNDSIRQMTQEEKNLKKLEQEKYDEIIATFFSSFPCPKCSFLVCTFGEMRKHFNSEHSGIVPSVLCCGKRFPERRTLVDHILVHLNPEHFKCSECGQCLPNSGALKKHVKSHSETLKERPAFVCETCSKSFTNKNSLKEHFLMKHTPKSEYKFSCNECPKKFPTKSHMKKHAKVVHHPGGAAICDQCGKSFSSTSALNNHKQLKHSDNPPAKAARVECPICKKSLSSNGLNRHIQWIHKETRNVDECRCHICGYLSSNSRGLKMHIYYNHEAERKFKCTMCDKAFKKNETLKEHIAMHTGEGVHTCPECQMTFACKANFYKHRQRRHGYEPVKRNLIGLAEKKLQKLNVATETQA